MKSSVAVASTCIGLGYLEGAAASSNKDPVDGLDPKFFDNADGVLQGGAKHAQTLTSGGKSPVHKLQLKKAATCKEAVTPAHVNGLHKDSTLDAAEDAAICFNETFQERKAAFDVATKGFDGLTTKSVIMANMFTSLVKDVTDEASVQYMTGGPSDADAKQLITDVRTAITTGPSDGINKVAKAGLDDVLPANDVSTGDSLGKAIKAGVDAMVGPTKTAKLGSLLAGLTQNAYEKAKLKCDPIVFTDKYTGAQINKGDGGVNMTNKEGTEVPLPLETIGACDDSNYKKTCAACEFAAELNNGKLAMDAASGQFAALTAWIHGKRIGEIQRLLNIAGGGGNELAGLKDLLKKTVELEFLTLANAKLSNQEGKDLIAHARAISNDFKPDHIKQEDLDLLEKMTKDQFQFVNKIVGARV